MDERLDDRLTSDSSAPRHQLAGEPTGDARGSTTVSTIGDIQQPTESPVCCSLLLAGSDEVLVCQDSMAWHFSAGQPRCSGGRAGAGGKGVQMVSQPDQNGQEPQEANHS